MPGNLPIANLIIGIFFLGFGVYLIFYPLENLRTFPYGLKELAIGIFMLYGAFRLLRGVMDIRRNRD